MDFITCNIGNLVTHTEERRGRREKALPPINTMNRGKLTFEPRTPFIRQMIKPGFQLGVVLSKVNV